MNAKRDISKNQWRSTGGEEVGSALRNNFTQSVPCHKHSQIRVKTVLELYVNWVQNQETSELTRKTGKNDGFFDTFPKFLGFGPNLSKPNCQIQTQWMILLL